jgi:hypothetical protein
MACEEVKTNKYQTRKSPAFHAKDCKGQTKKGKNGQYISKPDAKGTYKWVRVQATRKVKGKHYDIHDNGNRPFRVYIDGNKVAIYKDTNTGINPESGKFYTEANYSKLVKELTVKKVYVGKDHRPQEAIFAGNSILLHVSGNKYIHVGSSIYEFQMDDTVDKYFSIVGNSDVPYPVLLGTDNVYFMLEDDHSYLPRDMFPADFTKVQWEDAYVYFYGFKDPLTGEYTKRKNDRERRKLAPERHAKKMKGYRLIQKRI